MVTCECYVQDIIYDDPREGSSTIYYTCDNCRNRVKHNKTSKSKKNGAPGPNLAEPSR